MNTKDPYREKIEAQLSEWKADIEKLKAKAKGAGADAKIKLNDQISAFENQMEKGKQQLSSTAQSGKDSWESIRKELETSFQNVKTEVSRFAEQRQ